MVVIVILSMPGYGFSGKPQERGFNQDRIAGMWVQLIARLGYGRYIVHGSDWGNLVATRMVLEDAARVTALHLEGVDCVGTPSNLAPIVPTVNAAVKWGPQLRIPGNPIDQTPDARACVERLARRSGFVDHRQMVHMERSRRRS
jgi:pimeloyl-ACP methyl ester carboxylesterase